MVEAKTEVALNNPTAGRSAVGSTGIGGKNDRQGVRAPPGSDGGANAVSWPASRWDGDHALAGLLVKVGRASPGARGEVSG